jgi:hypothetical protein
MTINYRSPLNWFLFVTLVLVLLAVFAPNVFAQTQGSRPVLCTLEYDLGQPKVSLKDCVPVGDPVPVPTPTPTPTPTPVPTPTPTPVPTPTPPAVDNDALFYRMGVARLSTRPAPNCTKQTPPCYGVVFNYTATPKSRAPYCEHVPGRVECEMAYSRMQTTPGAAYAELWMRHPSWGNTWEPMDHATHPGPDGKLGTSDDYPHPYNGHDKPYRGQTGRKEIAACPTGVRPDSADPMAKKCSVIVDVQQ